MKYLLPVILLVLAVSLSSCSRQNTLSTLDSTRVSYPGPPQLTADVEDIVEAAFLETGLPWDQATVDAIAQERIAIVAAVDHLQALLLVNTTIPYYVYKAKVEESIYHYHVLEALLDHRATTAGAMTRQGLELYMRIAADVNQELVWQKERLANETRAIDSQASKMDMDDVSNMYKTMKPLIGVVKKALL